MKQIIIGTAGHIDHGKTTLIKALTGRNTDRWEEEIRRGITIDLGFTYFDLPDGSRAGIIDVPGHEKFIPNMVAGVVGMDLVLLVIAADEGIMPQTREHMDILNLLGIEKCIVVLNKCDLVEEEWAELMEEEIREGFEGSFLEKAPIVRVSAATGEGLKELTDVILKMVKGEVREKNSETICRLPIDRVFSITGFGTVVTGTLVSGKISNEDALELYPEGIPCRVRNIQVHDENKKTAVAGQRVALNLAGIRKEDIKRGCVLAPPGSMKKTTLLDVKLRMLENTERVLENRTRLHLFTGTSQVLCRAVLLDAEELGAGEEGFVQLRLEEPVSVRRGDRFVVRFYSPMETIGGGIILEAQGGIKKRFKPHVIEELKRKESGSGLDVIELHVKSHEETLVTTAELAKLTAMSAAEVEECTNTLLAEGNICMFPMKKDTYVWTKDRYLLKGSELVHMLEKYQKEHPYRHGLKKAEVQMAHYKKIKPGVANLIFQAWENDGLIRSVDAYICTPGHEVPRDAAYDAVKTAYTKALKKAGLDFIKETDVTVKNVKDDVRADLVMLLREEGFLVKLGDDLLALASDMEACAQKMKEHLQEHPVTSISLVRDLYQTSRKNAKLILEYTDAQRITRKGAAESEWKKYS